MKTVYGYLLRLKPVGPDVVKQRVVVTVDGKSHEPVVLGAQAVQVGFDECPDGSLVKVELQHLDADDVILHIMDFEFTPMSAAKYKTPEFFGELKCVDVSVVDVLEVKNDVAVSPEPAVEEEPPVEEGDVPQVSAENETTMDSVSTVPPAETEATVSAETVVTQIPEVSEPTDTVPPAEPEATVSSETSVAQ